MKVGVTSGELRSAAGKMGKLRDQVHDILTNLETSLQAKGAAWGGDGYGSTFADGPQGYLAAHRNLTEGLGNTAKTLGSYCDGQKKAADALDRMDRRSADSFR